MSRFRLFILFLLVGIFSIGVLIWYFFFITPQVSPTLGGTNNPLPSNSLPARFEFITKYFSNDVPSSESTTTVTTQAEIPLRQVWKAPATGQTLVFIPIIKEVDATSTVVTKATTTIIAIKKSVRATSTILMFVDKTTGYVYGDELEIAKTYQITNTTLPGIYDAYLFNNAKQILLRYLDADGKNIISIIATIPNVPIQGSPLPLINISYLPQNVSSVAVSASSNKISYLVAGASGSSIYTITNNGQTLTATSPFSEWNLSYGGEQLFATSKASAYTEGSTVLIPSFTRIIGDKTGLTSLPSKKGPIINSMWGNGGLVTYLFSGNGTTLVLPIKTLSVKCVWDSGLFAVCGVPNTIPNSSEGLPDDWYQGTVSFNDSLVLVDTEKGNTYPIYSFDEGVGEMDITHLVVSSDRTLISFIRKQNGTLWLLNTNLLPQG